MNVKEELENEENKVNETSLADLPVDQESAAEMNGGAIAGIVIAATTDNNRIA